ncbi:MAG: restriction endonuclease subunit S [Deltaproteobacteria bacterium]|nr:restriction endonuclease subunit S [Deltaproteobacteria bacterium]
MTNSPFHPRTFTVWSDELDGILSPLFFISKPVNKKGFVELKEVALVNPTRKKPVFGNDAIVPYVGLPETNDQQIREIWMRPYKQVRGRNIIRKGDILFARIEPSVFNKKYILVDDLKEYDFAFTSTEFYIVEPKENINPLFLFYMFFVQPVYDQVIGKTTGSTGRRRLDKGAFEKILIPLPTRKVQDQVVSYLQNAYAEKRKKEEEIQKILASIDGYVLGELGIDIAGKHERESK